MVDKKLAQNLSACQQYDHKIILMEGTKPNFRPLYERSREEPLVLTEDDEHNLEKGFIRSISSPPGSAISIDSKGRWISSPLHSLLGTEPYHNQESIPSTTDSRNIRLTLQGPIVYQVEPLARTPPNQEGNKRRMENSLPQPLQTLIIQPYAVWPHQCALHLPKFCERLPPRILAYILRRLLRLHLKLRQ